MTHHNTYTKKSPTVQGELLAMANAIVGDKVGDRLPQHARITPPWNRFQQTLHQGSPLIPIPRMTTLAVVGEYTSQIRSIEALAKVSFLFNTGDRADVVTDDNAEAYENDFYTDVMMQVTKNWMSCRKFVAAQAFQIPGGSFEEQLPIDTDEQEPKFKITFQSPRLAEAFGAEVA